MNESNELNRWLPVITIVALFISACFVVVAFFGYAKVQINMQPGNSITINGHLQHNGILKLKPGTYSMKIYSPTYTAVSTTLHVSPFQTKTVNEGQFQKRDPSNIVRSVLGAYSGYGAPYLYGSRYFQNGTWLVGLLNPGAAQPVALHYEHGTWTMIYFGDVGYEHDASALPTDVAGYVNELLGGLING